MNRPRTTDNQTNGGSAITPESFTIVCEDCIELTADLYRTLRVTPRAAVMIGPATGIRQEFYASFAVFLAEQGYAVVTFDNRGIGRSLQAHVSDSDASLVDWGSKDMPAVLNWLIEAFPDSTYHLIGHSAGGQLAGLMPNAHRLSTMFNVACSSGNLRQMPWRFRPKARFFMNFFIPVSNFLFGHTKSQWFGMGEPLPKNVGAQWNRWCSGEGYAKTDFGKAIKWHCYDDLQLDSMWINASDDSIATDANVGEMIAVYKRIRATRKTLIPADSPIGAIGHMRFFSQKNLPLWTLCTDWLDAHN